MLCAGRRKRDRPLYSDGTQRQPKQASAWLQVRTGEGNAGLAEMGSFGYTDRKRLHDAGLGSLRLLLSLATA